MYLLASIGTSAYTDKIDLKIGVLGGITRVPYTYLDLVCND